MNEFFFLVKQMQVWTTGLFHSEIKIYIKKQYIKSSNKQEISA